MSTPYELPVEPDLVQVPLDTEAPVLPSRAPLWVVPDPEAPEPSVDFEDFVRRHSPRLRRLIMRKLGDPSEAEEIAQETLLRAHQHLHTLRTENDLIAWTTVVGQRLAIDRIRVRGRSVAVAEVPEDSRVGRDTAEIVVARAEARTALEALEAIPERQAAILWAREVEGLQYDAIAERFDITEPAVRSLLHRGRKALRVEYAARGGTLPLRSLLPLAPGLLALRGLGRLRAAARNSVKTNVSAFATLSVAGAFALGMGVGSGGSPVTTPGTQRLGQTPVAQGSAVSGFAAEPGSQADRLAGSSVSTSVGMSRPSALDDVGRMCTQPDGSAKVCVASGQNKGDILYIGPTLPENPLVDRVGIGQNLVGVCEHLPGTPVTECSAGQQHGDGPLLAVSTATIDSPSSIEGAQK